MFEIRFAKVEDARKIAEIHVKSWQIAYRNIIPNNILDNISIEKRFQYFENAISNKLEEDVVIINDGEIVGFMCIGKCRDENVDDSYGEIWGIYLHPDFYYQGYGSKLIEFGINELKNRHYQHITLWVLEENENARKFYEKHGFSYDGTAKEFVKGRVLKELRYHLML